MHPLRVADLASLASVSVGGMGKGKDGASRVPWRVRDPAWRLDFQNLVRKHVAGLLGRAGLLVARVLAGLPAPGSSTSAHLQGGWTGCHLRRGGAKEGRWEAPQRRVWRRRWVGEQHLSTRETRWDTEETARRVKGTRPGRADRYGGQGAV